MKWCHPVQGFSPQQQQYLCTIHRLTAGDFPIDHLIPKWLLLGLFKIISKKPLIKIIKSGDTPHSTQEPSHSIHREKLCLYYSQKKKNKVEPFFSYVNNNVLRFNTLLIQVTNNFFDHFFFATQNLSTNLKNKLRIVVSWNVFV